MSPIIADNEAVSEFALAEDLVDETEAREGVDAELASNIIEETDARIAADSTLQGEIDALGGAGQVGFVAHGTDDDALRTDHDLVIWYGSVEPTNSVAPDVWIQEGGGGGGGSDSAALQAHVAASTNVHGIVDASKIVYTSDTRLQPTIEKVTLTSARTLATTDAGKVLEFNTGSTPATLTIPAGLSTSYPIDGITEFFQMGTGAIDVDGTAVTLRTPDSATGLDGQYRTGYLRRRGTDDWVLSGSVS